MTTETPAVGRPAFDPAPTFGLAAAVAAAWCTVILFAQHAHVGAVGHRVALTLHLASLAIGFGAVLATDGYGLAVLAGRRTVAQMLDFSGLSDRFIWSGFAGLAVSGIFLDPDFGSGWTDLNLAAVLVAALNGVYARTIRERLPALPPGAGFRDLPRVWIARAACAALLSQAAWWTSILVGSLTS